MSVYLDPLSNHGWKLRGHQVKSSHMIADDLDQLHAMARSIGMRRAWFQPTSFPHYDLTASRRELAIERGAVDMGRHEFVRRLRHLRLRIICAYCDRDDSRVTFPIQPGTPHRTCPDCRRILEDIRERDNRA